MRTGYAVKALIGASVGAALLMGVAVTSSDATAVTLTGTGAGARSASVTFDTLSFAGINYLTVVLTNTATYDSQIPTEILTAIFFSLPGDPTLSRTAGLSGAYTNPFNSSDIKGGPDVLNIGTEWAYRSGLSVSGFNQGLSSISTNVFGADDRFITCTNCDLQGPDSPEGLQYGITTTNDNSGNDTGGVVGAELVRNSVIFLLGGIAAGFDPSTSITSVRFQYGTDLAETTFGNGGQDGISSVSIARVPYPSSLALIGFGALGAVLIARRRRLAVSRVRS